MTFHESTPNYVVYGPYTRDDGRQHVVLYDSATQSRKTISYPKFLLCTRTGVSYDTDLTCDHIDGDFTNNAPSNLQWLTREANASKDAPATEMQEGECPQCGTAIQKPARIFRRNEKEGKAGPFCDRSCAGKFSTTRQDMEVAA